MRSPIRWLLAVLATFLALGFAVPASAHKPSDAYLFVDVGDEAVHVRWDIALRDLDAAFELDRDGDRQLKWGEVRARFAEIDAYALGHLVLDQGRCQPTVQGHAVDQHSDGAYLVIELNAPCKVGAQLMLAYSLFANFDPTHRGVAKVAFGNGTPRLVVLDPAHGPVAIGRDDASASPDDPFAGGFVPAGIHHILIGYDHILFLICLLLPAVLSRASHHRQPVARWTDAARPILVTVTAFTVAHTMTLALAALRIVVLSPRIVEPAIAATIIFTAIGNLRPSRFRDSPLMPFVFGLVHGFGFADVLRELDLPLGQFAWALVRFNVGVELGQLVIVAVTLTPLFLIRRWPRYRAWLLAPVSCFAIAVAALWFAERVFDFKVLPV
jgi:HupE / UreJ protein